MQLKRFIAKDNHNVLKLVREELGADAIIISNRKVDNGIEVIASAGYDESQVQASLQAEISVHKSDLHSTVQAKQTYVPTPLRHDEATATTQSMRTETHGSTPNAHNDATIGTMQAELSHLRSLLDSQMAAMQAGQWGQQSKARTELFEKLARIGLGVKLINQLIAATDVGDDLETASRKVLIKLKNAIKITKYDVIEHGGIVALHGPTGAGKTTTIAKLATQFLMHNDARDIVLVCADDGRVGAYAQLQTFGKLLGVSVIRVRHVHELKKSLNLLDDKKLVLIDSAGMVQSDLRHPERLFGMGSDIPNIHHYLALPATMQRAAMEKILDSMGESEIEGVILTKLDDAVHLGSVLTALLRHSLPLAYWTDGQSISNDIAKADATVLVSKAMHLNKSTVETIEDRLMASMFNATQKTEQLWQ